MTTNPGPASIELSGEEQAILERISFEHSRRTGYEEVRRNGDAACDLAISLMERDAIPEPRKRYFLDPDYHPGGRGKSRMQLFERNGTSGKDILRHPHFLPYLWYFIYGANLSQEIISAFRERVAECGMVTSGDVVPLGECARRFARARSLDPGEAAEEFYKLSLDYGLNEGYARILRKIVKRLR